MQNTPYSWKVWVSIMEQMLKNQSIKRIRAYLINNGLVQNIDVLTVSAIENKIRAAFAHMEQPVLHGVIQCDEKHFKESQKGIKNPHDVLNPGKRRKGRRRTKPTKYGTMGPEFSTICCAVDSSGHANAKVITIGQAGLCCRCRHHELRWNGQIQEH